MIQIRELQHFLYCPHRWGVLHLENGWKENVFTILAEIFHERVHSGEKSYAKGKTILRDVTVYSEKLGLYGKLDCMEIINEKEDENGIKSVNVIEYKPKQPKEEEVALADKLQLYAQYRCVKSQFNCKVNSYMYYRNTKRRLKVEFNEEDESLLLKTISEITNCRESGTIPAPIYNNRCNGCSMGDDCMPKVSAINVKKMLLKNIDEEIT